MPGTLDWIWSIPGSLLLLIGLFVTYRSLFSDRNRRLPRCPRCWYDMNGIGDTLRCPECGHEASSPKQLHRVRRRWVFATIGIVLILAARPVWIMPWFKRLGWMAIIPTDLLVRIAPVDESAWLPASPPVMGYKEWKFSGPKDPLLAHLIRRTQTAYVMKPRHWRAFLDRYFNANPDDLFNVVRTRSMWAADVPLIAHLNRRHPLITTGVPYSDFNFQIYARIDEAGSGWTAREVDHLPYYKTIGTPSGKTPTTRLEIEIQRPGYIAWHGYSPPITIAAHAEDVMTGYDRADLSSKLIANLNPRVIVSADGEWLLMLRRLCCHIDDEIISPDWALGFQAEVVSNGSVIAHTEALYHMVQKGADANHMSSYSRFPLQLSNNVRGASSIPPGPYTLRFKGAARPSLRDLDRTNYWSGELEVTLPSVPQADSYEQMLIDRARQLQSVGDK